MYIKATIVFPVNTWLLVIAKCTKIKQKQKQKQKQNKKEKHLRYASFGENHDYVD